MSRRERVVHTALEVLSFVLVALMIAAVVTAPDCALGRLVQP